MSKLFDLLYAMCGKTKRPDLSQNDPEAADYVKGVIRQESLPEGYPYKKALIAWDGNTEGRDNVTVGSMTYYKVSDQVLSAEQLVGGTVLVSGPAEIDAVGLAESFLITPEMLRHADGVCIVHNVIIQILSSSVLDFGGGLVLPSTGTYVNYIPDGVTAGDITFTAPVFCSKLDVITPMGASYLPEIPAEKLPEIPAEKLPEIPAEKLPEIPAEKLPDVWRLTLKLNNFSLGNIAGEQQILFTFTESTYEDILAAAKKGLLILSNNDKSYMIEPTVYEVSETGLIGLDFVIHYGYHLHYISLACNADGTYFYRNNWFKVAVDLPSGGASILWENPNPTTMVDVNNGLTAEVDLSGYKTAQLICRKSVNDATTYSCWLDPTKEWFVLPFCWAELDANGSALTIKTGKMESQIVDGVFVFWGASILSIPVASPRNATQHFLGDYMIPQMIIGYK